MSQPEISLGRFLALTALTGTPFRFVKLSSGKIALCGAGEAGLGVVQDEPAASEAGNVMLVGVSKVLAGGTINQGNAIKSDATGKAVAASETDQFIFGTALEDGSSGEYIDVLLLGQNMARESQAIVQLSAVVPALATDSEGTPAVFRAPFDCTVLGVGYVPVANITGANTDSRTINVINKGADGNGTTEIASIDFTSGVNATDYNETALTLSPTPADLDVDEGDVIAWASLAPGTGIADPGGLAVITIQRR